MKKEIDKAVETFHRIALGTRKLGNKIVTEGKLASFVTVLTELLLIRYKNNWYPANPNRGSGYRCLRINGQCIDPTIVESLRRAKIGLQCLGGTELTIWVDPGVVSVRIGEEGSIGSEVVDEDVFRLSIKAMPPLQQPTDAINSSDDEAYSSRSPSPAEEAQERPMSVSPPLNPTSSAQVHSLPLSSADFSHYSTSSPQVSYRNSNMLPQQRRLSPPRMMGKGMPVSNQPRISSGHIPSQTSYAQGRVPPFYPTDNGSFHHDGYYREGVANANFLSRQGMPMHMGMIPNNLVDIPIPAMA